MNTLELEDVIHHYMGCRARVTYSDGEVREWQMENVNTYQSYWGMNLLSKVDQDVEVHMDDVGVDDGIILQIFLRRLNNLLPVDKAVYLNLCVNGYDTAESLIFLFKHQVDCFDLIDRGFAIDIDSPETAINPIEKCERCKGTGKRLKQDGSQGKTDCFACRGTGIKKRKFEKQSTI